MTKTSTLRSHLPVKAICVPSGENADFGFQTGADCEAGRLAAGARDAPQVPRGNDDTSLAEGGLLEEQALMAAAIAANAMNRQKAWDLTRMRVAAEQPKHSPRSRFCS